jgi:hypothetical protein
VKIVVLCYVFEQKNHAAEEIGIVYNWIFSFLSMAKMINYKIGHRHLMAFFRMITKAKVSLP